MLPSLFLAHGAPTLAIEDSEYTRFLKTLGESIHPRPKAIVVFSAHWTARTVMVSTSEQPETIYDFGGFPDELYRMTYRASGSREIADKALTLFGKYGIHAEADPSRGFDHGVWVLLTHLFPEADIPVVSISVNPLLPVREQVAIGQALSELRAEDVLIIGSGGTVHNLRAVKWGQPEVDEWAIQFDEWLANQMHAWDVTALDSYRENAPHATMAAPTVEHFMPLFLAMGAAGDKHTAERLFQSYDFGNLSLAAWQFGA